MAVKTPFIPSFACPATVQMYVNLPFFRLTLILALLPGISRDGSVMVAGLVRGLSRQDAARFSFLLSAPVIFAAGVFKASELLGSETAGIRGQILVGSIISGIGAYLALRFLDKYLSNPKRTLTPFAVYCLVMGIGSALYLGIG